MHRRIGVVLSSTRPRPSRIPARQTRAVKELQADARIALTGTPVENRMSDLWSIFDFLNPGLLGSGKDFTRLIRQLEKREHNPYGPLCALIQPYILRRLKTDKAIIGDLPEKTEVKAFCHLTKAQAALYQQSVDQLAEELRRVEGIQRRGSGVVLPDALQANLQPPVAMARRRQLRSDSQRQVSAAGGNLRGTGRRQEKALIFSQFREIADPLAGPIWPASLAGPAWSCTARRLWPSAGKWSSRFSATAGRPFSCCRSRPAAPA